MISSVVYITIKTVDRCLLGFSVPMYTAYEGLSSILFCLTWKGNGAAAFDEIWQAGPS